MRVSPEPARRPSVGGLGNRRPSDPLIISSIETIPVVAPLAKVFRGSNYEMSSRATLITKVHTEPGITGVAYVGDEDHGLLEIESIVQNELSPALLGMDAFATERCWEAGYPVTFDILRDRRLGLVALAGVDTAIWDAVGQALETPLWRLWGGYRDKIPLIVIGGYYGEPVGTIEDEIGYYREQSFAGVKFKVGGRSPSEDARRVERARAAGGDEFMIAVDANQGYSVTDAISFARMVGDLNVRWFEEPVRWHNDRRSLRDVRMRTSLPICAGQSEFSVSGCRDLMEAGAIDICNFDSSWSGGPTVWRRAAALATAYDCEVGHHEEPQIAAHLLASQPHGTVAECFHPDRDPFWWNLISNGLRPVNGLIQLSNAPGLGWEIDWDYVDKYRVRSK